MELNECIECVFYRFLEDDDDDADYCAKHNRFLEEISECVDFKSYKENKDGGNQNE